MSYIFILSNIYIIIYLHVYIKNFTLKRISSYLIANMRHRHKTNIKRLFNNSLIVISLISLYPSYKNKTKLKFDFVHLTNQIYILFLLYNIKSVKYISKIFVHTLLMYNFCYSSETFIKMRIF